MPEQMKPEAGPEKDPKEVAKEALEDFLTAYRAKYENEEIAHGDFEKNITEYIAMFEAGEYTTLKESLIKALDKYTKIQEHMYETGPVEKESVEEKAIVGYENIAEKTEAAIQALEVLE
ncbi:MAG: hypothetical protein HOE19_01655 [Candidatus Komeilibacteria bacterium]|jgi:hypothetical protein|nr:hypothetical protein [Candidatus Komeilibacteria bacterium]MBT4447512.1 hypothetical protein [Candidatus Komeilibacteria bacterium]